MTLHCSDGAAAYNTLSACRFTPAIDRINAALRAFCTAANGTSFLDANGPFMAANGSLDQRMLPDALHPSAQGEAAMDAIRAPFLADLLKQISSAT